MEIQEELAECIPKNILKLAISTEVPKLCQSF